MSPNAIFGVFLVTPLEIHHDSPQVLQKDVWRIGGLGLGLGLW